MKHTVLDFKGKWDNYHMTIDLTKFMQDRGVTRMKKLIKYIRESETPEELEKIKAWMDDFLETYEDKQKEKSKEMSAYVIKVKYCEKELNKEVKIREGTRHFIAFGQVDPAYAEINERIMDRRGELRGLKRDIKDIKKEFNDYEKLKDYVKKIYGLVR